MYSVLKIAGRVKIPHAANYKIYQEHQLNSRRFPGVMTIFKLKNSFLSLQRITAEMLVTYRNVVEDYGNCTHNG